METMMINGQSYDVYTMADWERDKTLKVKVGQVIEPDVYYQLLNSVPPKVYRGDVFQPGEPDSWDWDGHCELYLTFERVEGEYYKYVGLKP